MKLGMLFQSGALFDSLNIEENIVYINGATAEPWLNTISIPNNAKTIIIGNNQYFFRTFKNSQNSLINSIIKIVYS